MLEAASGYMAGADLVSSGRAVNVTLAGASRMTRHSLRVLGQLLLLHIRVAGSGEIHDNR